MGSPSPDGADLARALADRIAAIELKAVPRPALAQARTCIIDTIGVTLAGMREPATRILLDTPGVATAPGESLIFGSARKTSALDATLVNGTASHALDYDDFSGAMGGHHSVPLVALLFALGQERRASGKDVLLAYVAGVETELKLARAVNFQHYDKGWHPTATLGVFGAAAAACRLMRLGPEKIATALGIAASLASGIKANFGTMTKPLHIGQCGRNGLFAALLAERGFEAAPDVFEHHQGFLDVFNGAGTYDVAKMLEGWGAPFEIADTSIGLKQFPCCGSTHAAIMMALALAEEEGIGADDAARIEILPHGRRLRHTNTPSPESPLDAKFSVQYVVARALKDRAVRLDHFEGDAHADPAIRSLLERTEARPHPQMADDAALQWGAEVIVTTRDGRTLSRRTENFTGRGPDNPMSEDELWEKFNDCARRALPREQVAPLFERLMTLDAVADMGQLVRLMQVSPLHEERKGPITFAAASEQAAPETTWVP